MRLFRTLGVRWITVFIIVLIAAIFNPVMEDFEKFLRPSFSGSMSFDFEDDQLATDIETNGEEGQVSIALDDSFQGIAIAIIDDKDITRTNLIVFSIYEYDKGDRIEKYIGIFNHFIEIK